MRLAVPALFLSLALTGCAIAPTASPVPLQGLSLQGEVHGGQQPIQYAHVYLFAANTTGYGGPGIAPSSLNASVPLLKATSPGVYSDSVGTYVLTTNKGNFSIDGDYTCTPNTQAYLYVLGGNPGSGTNAASGLLAALGNCPTADNYTTSVPYISINEISTVAAAYAMAGFASDATHVSSSGTALAQTGIANAFANATNLANIGTGAALATTPAANGGNGTVPHDEILTLANILASCINTTGTVTGPTNPTTCYTLFKNTLAYGTSTQPTDTATAAINIAHNPGTNVGNLFSLAAAKTPYTTTAAYGQPNDWTLGINFSGGNLNYPLYIAIDGYGDAWVGNDPYTYPVNNNLTKLSPTGAILSGTSGFPASSTSPDDMTGVVIDASNDVWVPNYYSSCNQYGYCFNENQYTVRLNNAGTRLSSYYLNINSEPGQLVIDGTGNAWLTDGTSLVKLNPTTASQTTYSVGYVDGPVVADGAGDIWSSSYNSSPTALIKLNSSGTVVSPTGGYTGGGFSGATAMAIDGGGNVWVLNQNVNEINEFANNGTPVSTSAGYTGGGLNQPTEMAIDGAGNVWVSNFVDNTGTKGALSEFTNKGAALSPATGYASSGLHWPLGVAVDGSGDVWTANQGSNFVTELIGAATPVVTPIAAGLPATPTTDGSSKLATRP
jgi:hypothetical protein